MNFVYLRNVIVGNLSLQVKFENLSLMGQEETYVSLEMFSFEAKVLLNKYHVDYYLNVQVFFN